LSDSKSENWSTSLKNENRDMNRIIKMKKIRYFLLFFLVSSCTSYPETIEDVLQQAGNNRKELEKVLKRYSRRSSDSLKFRAAGFLIVNMPGKYSEYMEGEWNDLATVSLRMKNMIFTI